MNTTLEIPEGSKAVISGKVIDGKNYLVVEVENEEQKEPEWTKFKRGDVLINPNAKPAIFAIFGEYGDGHSKRYFDCLFNSRHYGNTNWISSQLRKATEEEKQVLLDMLAKDGLMWDAEKLELVKIPDVPEWKNFKRGDVLICPDAEKEIFVIFDEYMNNSNHACFSCIFNVTSDENTLWMTDVFRKATKEEEKRFFKWLREERGLEWDGEKLVEVPKKGDMCIFWDSTPNEAMICVYKEFEDDHHIDHLDFYWDNAIKWDGTKEQYEKVLRGEL